MECGCSLDIVFISSNLPNSIVKKPGVLPHFLYEAVTPIHTVTSAQKQKFAYNWLIYSSFQRPIVCLTFPTLPIWTQSTRQLRICFNDCFLKERHTFYNNVLSRLEVTGKCELGSGGYNTESLFCRSPGGSSIRGINNVSHHPFFRLSSSHGLYGISAIPQKPHISNIRIG